MLNILVKRPEEYIIQTEIDNIQESSWRFTQKTSKTGVPVLKVRCAYVGNASR